MVVTLLCTLAINSLALGQVSITDSAQTVDGDVGAGVFGADDFIGEVVDVKIINNYLTQRNSLSH